MLITQLPPFQQVPYKELVDKHTNFAIMMRVSEEGLRPEVPVWTPPSLKALIADCLAGEPVLRPSFKTVLTRLAAREVMEYVLPCLGDALVPAFLARARDS